MPTVRPSIAFAMKMIVVLFVFSSCGSDKSPVIPTNPPEESRNVFQLELNTWTPDALREWQIRGDVINFVNTERNFNVNSANRAFKVELLRGIMLFQVLEDSVITLGTGEGITTNKLNIQINLVEPNQVYKLKSRADSVVVASKEVPVYYTNFWYEPSEIGKSQSRNILAKEFNSEQYLYFDGMHWIEFDEKN